MNWKMKVLAFGLACSSLCSAHSAAIEARDVRAFTLDNGMQFLVLESRAIPNANVYTYWKVGSRNEAPGITGLSHFFEHMMFNGSRQFGPKQFDRVMEAAGGANNAYTNKDVTVYQDWFPAGALPTIFELEADRIGALSIAPKMVESERGVVLSERSTGLENSNLRALWEEVYATAFHAHPYAIPTIGHESDIKAWTQADLEHYFQTYYTPNNALMVIVGDVDAEKVRTLAEQRFASLPARALPPRVRTIEPEQKGERRVFVRKASAHTANIMVSYKAPPARHADYYPLLLLEALLTEGKASRLHKALVDTRLASEVGSDFSHSLDPGLFNLFAVAASKVSAATLERALLAELDTLVRTGVSEAELNRARQQKRMQYYRQLETINGKASLLGDYQVFFGDYRLAFEVPAALDRVTPEEVRQVAERYMRPSARTVGVLAAQEE